MEYDKANIVVRNSNGKQSVLTLQFKKFSGDAKVGDFVSICGNLRSYSRKISEQKNKVNVYVFTYFDQPDSEDDEIENQVLIDGRICKIEPLRNLANGKCNIHFILANNIVQGSNKLNSYIPCIAWGKCAKEIAKLSKNDNIAIRGELRSREYKKPTDDGKFEIRVAHELVVQEFEADGEED